MSMSQTPLRQYRENRQAYSQIADLLSQTKQVFEQSDRHTQKVMLFDSTVFAVMSVQNSTDILKQSFRSYCRADNWSDVRDACSMCNYGNNKYNYIELNFETIFETRTGDYIIDTLIYDGVWSAVKQLVDTIMGVSWVKAPFVCSMLGYTDVMCIDTNVEQMIDDSAVKSKDYSSEQQYRNAVQIIKETYSELAEKVSTFMLQWIIFDANRETGVIKHEEWFENILPGNHFGRQMAMSDY
jgi:thermostable 8-oxoguanine DNA glycosylase